jgi:hypothetical protein
MAGFELDRASGGGGGGSSGVPDSTEFVEAETLVQPMGGVVSNGAGTPPNLVAGEIGAPAMTDDRALWIYNAYLQAGENQTANKQETQTPCTPIYISTATTTVCKSGSGVMFNIVITESVASTIIGYDNTAGSGAIVFSLPASFPVGSYLFSSSFATGLTIVTAGASKLTVNVVS